MAGSFALNTAGIPALKDTEYEIAGAGEVDVQASAQRTLTVGTVGANNALDFKTVAGGPSLVTVAITNDGVSQALSVTVSSNAITIHAATNGSSVITSTAAQVITAYNLVGAATALATIANTPGSSGAGVVAAVAPTAELTLAPLVVSDSGAQALLRSLTFQGSPVFIET